MSGHHNLFPERLERISQKTAQIKQEILLRQLRETLLR
jgi:hypothetical protein